MCLHGHAWCMLMDIACCTPAGTVVLSSQGAWGPSGGRLSESRGGRGQPRSSGRQWYEHDGGEDQPSSSSRGPGPISYKDRSEQSTGRGRGGRGAGAAGRGGRGDSGRGARSSGPGRGSGVRGYDRGEVKDPGTRQAGFAGPAVATPRKSQDSFESRYQRLQAGQSKNLVISKWAYTS